MFKATCTEKICKVKEYLQVDKEYIILDINTSTSTAILVDGNGEIITIALSEIRFKDFIPQTIFNLNVPQLPQSGPIKDDIKEPIQKESKKSEQKEITK
jgi:hypothetical protein